jgi:hypothetical protein
MKRLLIFITITLVPICTYAQKFYGGVEAGWNISYPTGATNARSGFNVGVFGEMIINKHWYADAALKLTSAPWETKERYFFENGNADKGVELTQKATPYSLQLPLHAGFSTALGNTINLRIAAGPYLGIGLFGTGECEYITQSPTTESATEKYSISNIYSDETYAMKRFEVGIDGRIGIEISTHYLITLGYQYQFNTPVKNFTPIGRSQVFSLNVGYKF